MAQVVVLILCSLPLATHQLTYSSIHRYEKTEIVSEISARQVFASTTSLVNGLEVDLTYLTTALHSSGVVASLIQLTTELQATNSSEPAKLVAASKPAAAVKTPTHRGIDATSAAKQMAKMKPEQMPAMLGLLTGMYDSWKDKISEANKKEREQKTVFENTIRDLEAKKAQNKDSKDAAATYDRIEKYWKRQRSISHRQYHTALKIMHSGMAKFKSVSTVMQHAIDGKKPTAKDLQTVGMGMPDIVFLQREALHLVTWAQEASRDLHSAKVLN